MRNVLLMVGSGLPTLSTIVYIISVVQGKTKPHRTTYTLFVLITSLTFASLLASHDRSGIWLAGVSVLQTLAICGLAFKWGMGGKDPFDVLCVLLCVGGIAVWLATGESLIGLLAAIVADFLALLPALRKMWRHPYTEIWTFYALDTVAALAIVAAGPYGWRAVLYPGYLSSVNFLCVAIIAWRQRQKRIASLPLAQ
ncbi:MAG TPA: hypothetical protein VLF60_01590 [Candidatus Saccharimonadales bacterium]|nr:hypothetical protein [Candidatus Saccharimonadales bacterium]